MYKREELPGLEYSQPLFKQEMQMKNELKAETKSEMKSEHFSPLRMTVKVRNEKLKWKQFTAFLDLRIHKTPEDFMRYLSQVMPVTKESWLAIKSKPLDEIFDLRQIKAHDIILLRINQEPEAVTLYEQDMQKKAIVPVGKKYKILQPSQVPVMSEKRTGKDPDQQQVVDLTL